VCDPRRVVVRVSEGFVDVDEAHGDVIETESDHLDRRSWITALIVTHRLSLARTADRVIVLDAGRIAEEGHPEALRRQGGRYAALERAARAGVEA